MGTLIDKSSTHNKGTLYAQLRKLTNIEEIALHNRINIKQELLDCDINYELQMGRKPNSNIKANIALNWGFILLPLYRNIRESRYKGVN